MKQSPLLIEELIKRFQKNECSPEEIRLLQQWLMQLDVSDETTELLPEQLEAVKTRMYQQITNRRPAPVVRHKTSFRQYMVAAGWMALAATTILLWHFYRQSEINAQSKKVQLTVIENNQHGIKRITLPDGSQVCLNIHSRLEFDSHQFNQAQRYVKLTGEGFFEVEKNPTKPFIVETGNLHTRVLGTAFNIEAYEHESEIRVSLVHGKIALDDTATSQTTLLSPDHTFRYAKQTKMGQVLPVAAANVALWTKGWLVFNEVPLQEAIDRIGERYNLAIEYDQRLLQNKRITASFKTGHWTTILENILFVHGLHYSKKGEKVVINRHQATGSRQ